MRKTSSRTSSARAEILAAALETYRTHGPQAFTLGAAAKRAGLTTPALYRHFAGKSALLHELVTQGFELFAAYLSRGLLGRTPRERLMLTSAAYFDFAVEHPGHYETLFLSSEVPGLRRFPQDFESGRSATFQMLVDRVREAVDDGVLAKGVPHAIALSIWVHVHGFMSLHLMGRFSGNRAQVRALYDDSLQRLLKGLEGEKKKP